MWLQPLLARTWRRGQSSQAPDVQLARSPPAAGRAGGQQGQLLCACDRAADLPGLVAELKEEAEGLRGIGEREREIDWWAHTYHP